MSEKPNRYRASTEYEQRAKLYTECCALLVKLNHSAYAIKRLTWARDALRSFANYKANRTHERTTKP